MACQRRTAHGDREQNLQDGRCDKVRELIAVKALNSYEGFRSLLEVDYERIG